MQIEIKNLSHQYFKKTANEVNALNHVSLSIEKNDYVAFIGETGSGKSTLVQHLNALLIPDEGEIDIDDFKIINSKKNKRISELRKHVGLVFQFPEYQLFEETVEKDVAFGPKNFGDEEKVALEKAHQAILNVGLDESYFIKSPFELSGGEKRRVAITGILAINPDILVLDEPTAGLDPEGQEMILNLLDQLHEQGKTIILVTHDMSIVYRYCNKVFVLKNGNLVFNGEPNELFNINLDDYSIEVPPFYRLAKELKRSGFAIDFNHLYCQDDLIKQIKQGVKK